MDFLLEEPIQKTRSVSPWQRLRRKVSIYGIAYRINW